MKIIPEYFKLLIAIQRFLKPFITLCCWINHTTKTRRYQGTSLFFFIIIQYFSPSFFPSISINSGIMFYRYIFLFIWIINKIQWHSSTRPFSRPWSLVFSLLFLWSIIIFYFEHYISDLLSFYKASDWCQSY